MAWHIRIVSLSDHREKPPRACFFCGKPRALARTHPPQHEQLLAAFAAMRGGAHETTVRVDEALLLRELGLAPPPPYPPPHATPPADAPTPAAAKVVVEEPAPGPP